MGQWTNYVNSTTPDGTWTILCYPGSGQIREVALSDVFVQLVGANYGRTLGVDAVLSGTPQAVEVGGTASALQIATDEVKVAGDLTVTGHLRIATDGTANVGAAVDRIPVRDEDGNFVGYLAVYAEP